jgi:hypothetical protein
VDKHGQTVSATEFAELTGISRERLRTWERRFGFPRPVRVDQGPRRYALSDAARVVAVRRAAQEGVPLARAIEESAGSSVPAVSPAMLAGVAATAPTPILLVSGPQPLRVAWINASSREPAGAGGGLEVGVELERLSWFMGSDLERTLHTLFAGDAPALECAHPAWDGSDLIERSVAFRLPFEPGEAPTVALIGVDRADEQLARREVGELRGRLARMRAREKRLERWIGLTASLAERFQREADDGVLTLVTDMMVRGLGAIDAGIAVYETGELALRASSRGVLGSHTVTVTGYDDLAALMHAGTPGWLAQASGGAFGAPAGLHALAVPIVVVAETLGLLLVLFDERTELSDDARQLLTVVSAGLGFMLLRARLVAAGQDGGGRR